VGTTNHQQREGEGNAWEEWSTLNTPGGCKQSCSVVVPCQPVHTCLLNINSSFLTGCVMVMVQISFKSCAFLTEHHAMKEGVLGSGG
jgi:hypothetical protein